MTVTQILVLVGLIIVAVYAAMVFFGRQRKAQFEIYNEAGLFEELREFIVTFEFTAAYIHAYKTGTPISRVVGAGLERFDTGKEAVFSAMREAITEEQTRWQDSLLKLSICGIVGSAIGLVGVLMGLLGLQTASSLIALAPIGLNVLLAVVVASLAFAGHSALMRNMQKSGVWLEDTASIMLNQAARVVSLSTRITAPTPVQQPVMVRSGS
jgi:biopolymer transport protein ExbB/TolQ